MCICKAFITRPYSSAVVLFNDQKAHLNWILNWEWMACLELCQTSMKEPFMKIVNSFNSFNIMFDWKPNTPRSFRNSINKLLWCFRNLYLFVNSSFMVPRFTLISFFSTKKEQIFIEISLSFIFEYWKKKKKQMNG